MTRAQTDTARFPSAWTRELIERVLARALVARLLALGLIEPRERVLDGGAAPQGGSSFSCVSRRAQLLEQRFLWMQ